MQVVRSIFFEPLLSWAMLWSLAAVSLVLIVIAVRGGLSGWWVRGIALSLLLMAVANPSTQIEEREALSDLVLLVVDESASQGTDTRPAQTAEAIARVEEEVAALGNVGLRMVHVEDSDGNRGTLLMKALADAIASEPRARLAGVILVSDGQLHDIGHLPELPAPMHLLLTGKDDDWDRLLLIRNAPAFAIIDEPVTLTLKVEDQGAVPARLPAAADIDISVDGGAPDRVRVPVGLDVELSVTLRHGGMNVIQFTLPEHPNELTSRNNAAVVQINGVRDRLRVLLVSGQPHAGERTWRNLLKSDASVDLVHFTILRPPEKQDGVPVNELSLIAFPTRELFLDKVGEFDLIIFDRYKLRGIMPAVYLDSIRRHVEGGGALLVAAGPDFATAESIYHSPLAEILPAAPSGLVHELAYLPKVTRIGQRHPVTEGLEPVKDAAPRTERPWGRWLRQIDVAAKGDGHTLMDGLDDAPLLVIDRVGEGRVALLASDHAWLWSRGFEGGGPQLELLRRLAHWMMKEPDLEEEALTAISEGLTMTITRRTISDEVGDVEVVGPDGKVTLLPLEETAPGRYSLTWQAPETGLYRLSEGDQQSVAALGPAALKEFEATIASDRLLAGPVAGTRGGVHKVAEGVPDIRRIRQGQVASGRGWIGITPREAYLTTDIRVSPFLPAWTMLLLASLLMIGAWFWEGRR